MRREWSRTVSSDSAPLDILKQARESDDFRRVLITGSYMQVVVMTIPPGGEIGAETHPDTDQVLFFVDGEGESILDGERTPVGPGHLLFVRAGTHHNFINTGESPLRIATAYGHRNTSTGRCTRPGKRRMPTTTDQMVQTASPCRDVVHDVQEGPTELRVWCLRRRGEAHIAEREEV